LALCLALVGATARAQTGEIDASYRFLVSARAGQGGVLFTGTAGALRGVALPLSFVDSAAYWGDYVCRLPGNDCRVQDVYDPVEHTLRPPKGAAGDLQTERVNVHNGTNIYDAATWQIAVMLGAVNARTPQFSPGAAYTLASGQNRLLEQAHDPEASHFVVGANRAVTAGERFVYNGRRVTEPARAFAFRMLARRWLADDPLDGSPHASLITATGLPGNNPEYRAGRVSWADWKPLTGENAWAFLVGPLQAAWLHYVHGRHEPCVPFREPAVQNALHVLPTFAAMQSAIGGVHYAPSGTLRNIGEQFIDTREIVVENNASLYAGLRILDRTLRATLAHDPELAAGERSAIDAALALIDVMIHGGTRAGEAPTAGMLAFFRQHAWRNGEFVQGGLAQDPRQGAAWIPTSGPRAVDANTWTVAALGPATVDAWFGFGAAWENWQRVKRWGAYGVGDTLWGVGFSEVDGNGIGEDGQYRQGVLSSEWTAGAITMLRGLIAHYGAIAPDSPQRAAAQGYAASLVRDEQAMLAAVQRLRIDRYADTAFPGRPADLRALLGAGQGTLPYLYASRRYAIPFGWYANPLPSTCATAWMIMLAERFDPFGYGGAPN
jgi:hypothetical protein